MTIRVERDGAVAIVTIARSEVRNAVDRPAADALEAAFRAFDRDPDLSVAILTGADGSFCAGADLHALATADPSRMSRVEPGEHAPMGPTRLVLGKPVLAAIEGHAVAGGLELALWCDLRVAGADATLGVYNRRLGVPLLDGGTVRLPRIVGLSRALDLVLTGRTVTAEEALAIGLVDRVVSPHGALAAALTLARTIAAAPQLCLRSDRRSLLEGLDLPTADALAREHELGARVVASGEPQAAARRFAGAAGRHSDGLPKLT